MSFNSDSLYSSHRYILQEDLEDNVVFLILEGSVLFIQDTKSGGYKKGDTIALLSQTRILTNSRIEGEVLFGQPLYAYVEDIDHIHSNRITTDGESPNVKIGVATSSKTADEDYLPSLIFDTISVSGGSGDGTGTGPRGPRGLQGEQGEKGEKGDKGDMGDSGAPGPAGANGMDGSDGANGMDGTDGSDGEDGISFIPIYYYRNDANLIVPSLSITSQTTHILYYRSDNPLNTLIFDNDDSSNNYDVANPRLNSLAGQSISNHLSRNELSSALIGTQGPAGERGIQGEQGDRGERGLQGVKGDPGDKGDQGEQGIQGIKGDKGDMGERGLQGEMGLAGMNGEDGEDGSDGVKGDKGDKGDPGNDGEDGLTFVPIYYHEVNGRIMPSLTLRTTDTHVLYYRSDNPLTTLIFTNRDGTNNYDPDNPTLHAQAGQAISNHLSRMELHSTLIRGPQGEKGDKGDSAGGGGGLTITTSNTFAYNNDEQATSHQFTLSAAIPRTHSWVLIYGSVFLVEHTDSTYSNGIPIGTTVTLISHSRDIKNVQVTAAMSFGQPFYHTTVITSSQIIPFETLATLDQVNGNARLPKRRIGMSTSSSTGASQRLPSMSLGFPA